MYTISQVHIFGLVYDFSSSHFWLVFIVISFFFNSEAVHSSCVYDFTGSHFWRDVCWEALTVNENENTITSNERYNYHVYAVHQLKLLQQMRTEIQLQGHSEHRTRTSRTRCEKLRHVFSEFELIYL